MKKLLLALFVCIFMVTPALAVDDEVAITITNHLALAFSIDEASIDLVHIQGMTGYSEESLTGNLVYSGAGTVNVYVSAYAAGSSPEFNTWIMTDPGQAMIQIPAASAGWNTSTGIIDIDPVSTSSAQLGSLTAPIDETGIGMAFRWYHDGWETASGMAAGVFNGGLDFMAELL